MVNSLLIDELCLSHEKAEEWRAIPGYEGIYEASNLGRIRTAEGKTTQSSKCGVRVWRQRILRQKWQVRGNGRTDARVSLWKDKQEKTCLVSRLVCAAFHGVPSERETVNHINGDPADNRASNLEWLSLDDNIRHAFKTGLYSSIQRPVELTSENGSVRSFASMSSASRFLGRSASYVSTAVKRGRFVSSAQTAKKFVVQVV